MPHGKTHIRERIQLTHSKECQFPHLFSCKLYQLYIFFNIELNCLYKNSLIHKLMYANYKEPSQHFMHSKLCLRF